MKAISAHEIASNKEKAHFPFEDCMIFMTGVGVFDDILKIEHVLKCLMVFSKGAFSLKLCLRCKEQYQSHQICLGELFSCTRLCKGMLKKRGLLVFKKSSKLWHFSWKSCYFQMKKAPFWKWCFVWSNRCWKCIYHVCSFLAIYFQPSAIKSNLFWCSFFPYYDV